MQQDLFNIISERGLLAVKNSKFDLSDKINYIKFALLYCFLCKKIVINQVNWFTVQG